MNIIFRDAELKDKDFILNANKEINLLSGLDDSTFDNNIDDDLFQNKICKSIIAELDEETIGFILYSYIYWANCGKGVYLSQAYVKKEFRKQGILKLLLAELERKEETCNFITDFVGNENEIMIKSQHNLNFKPSNLIIYYRMIKKER